MISESAAVEGFLRYRERMQRESEERVWRGSLKAIYCLCDPEGQPRYVGATFYPKDRLSQHLRGARNTQAAGGVPTSKERWLIELDARGQSPVLRVLEFSHRSKAASLERRWIAFFLRQGHNVQSNP